MPNSIHRRLRAPTEDGAALIDPPLRDVPGLVERNRQIATQFDSGSGLPSGARMLARQAINQARLNFIEHSVNKVAPSIVMTGHQPELFHPGVWFKNFLAASIAQRIEAAAINLVIDNDLVRSTSVRVPCRIDGFTQVTEVPFDAPKEATTWESRNVVDEQIFRDFRATVHQVFEPVIRGRAEFSGGILLDQFWPHAVEEFELQKQRTDQLQRELGVDSLDLSALPPVLTKVLSAARRCTESEFGVRLDDVPLAWLGFDAAFGAFAGLLILRHREFHAIYNQALGEYRAVNRIRSQSHPVPELATEGGWLEMPFWVWTHRDPQRRRVFVREVGLRLELTDRRDVRLKLPDDVSDYRDALIDSEIELRPRALITTMYARLVLSDLFIHGIGGAKYDELTDLIIRRFFDIEPPAYMTATATFRLPIDRPQVSVDDVRSAARRIREARYRPESFGRDKRVKQDAELSARLAALAAEKREFLDQHDLRRCSQDVFDRLDQLNRAMQDLLGPVEEELRAEHAQLVKLLKQSQLLGSREFSFVLFPAEKLPARLLDLSRASS
jgi:hypothetical protein